MRPLFARGTASQLQLTRVCLAAEAISRLEGMSMTNATTMAKFERNMETKLEEMMSEVLQTTLATGETKETLSEMVSRTPLHDFSTCGLLVIVGKYCGLLC